MDIAIETQNMTLTLPQDVLRELKVIAARRGISISDSDLLIQALKDLVQQQDAYEALIWLTRVRFAYTYHSTIKK